jgi:putative phosphoesterase
MASPSTGLRIGLISDTHGLLRPEALEILRGSDAILHAGDIGGPDVLDALFDLAPVVAVRGNNDTGPWAKDYPERTVAEYGVARIYLLHDRKGLRGERPPRGCNVVVTGHSHRPLVEAIDGVLYVNPGSAGPRRFRLPISVAMLHIGDAVTADVVELRV